MWVNLIIAVVMLVVSYAIRPKTPSPTPAGIDSADIPTAEEGTPIPVVFGRVLVTGPNVTWYGALEAEPIYGSGGKK